MSYDIDTFKVKKIENLKIPISSLYKHERTDWYPQRENKDDGTVSFYVMDSFLSGRIENDILSVDQFSCYGEGSGTAMLWIFEPALKDSSGEFIASCVWEGGDAINQIIVKDGNIEWKDIEI